MANKISVIIDVAVDKGVTSLKKFRTAIGEADGAAGKMQAGFGVAKESIVANAANIAMAAGGALIAFGVKSVKAFQDTALAAGQFSEATGIAVEDASRWVEVAGDFGIEAGAVEGAMRKMNLAIANGKPVMDDFGDSIVRAKDGTVDSAATFQNLVTRIGAIKDPTERAKAAQEAFGKSYGDVARFMEMSATDLAAALGNVSEQKVIDEAELAKARKFQASMDELKDKLDDVTMTVGEEIVPVLSDLADKVSWVTDKFSAVSGAIEDVTGSGLFEWADQILNPLNAIGDAWDGLFGDDDVEAVEDVTAAIEYGTEAARDMATMYAERVPQAMGDTTQAFDAAAEEANDLAIQTGRVERAAEALGAEWDRLKGKVSDDQAWLDMQATFDDVRDKGAAAMQAVADGADNAEDLMREFQTGVNTAKDRIIELGKQIGMTPSEVEVLLTMTDNGSIDDVERRLAILTRNRTANLDIIARGGAGYGGRFPEARAAGGPVTAGTPYLVGERGPEIVVPGRSGTVIPNNRIGGTAGSSMVVNITTGADPQAVIAAIKKYEKSNGANWRS